MGHNSGSDSNVDPANAGGTQAIDFFDIDAFLDDYVTDLGNQDPLEINLDFSLPFPSRPPADPGHVGVHPIPGPGAAAPRAAAPLPAAPSLELTMPEPTSDSDAPSEPRARPQRATRARAPGAAAKAKAAKEDKPEPRSAAAQRKHLALQEKNRRAQRRFRERQKNRVVELEGQVDGLAAALAAMTTERDALARRALELEAAANNSAGNAGGSGGSPRAAAAPPLPAAPGGPTSEACSDSGHAPSAACAHGITLTPKAGGPPVRLSPAELCAMGQPALSGHFAALVKECARTFVEGAGTPEMEARVTGLADQALSLWQRVAACNPPTAKLFATAKLDEAGRGQPADERAPHIVRSLGLADAQKAELCALRRGLLARVAATAAARAAAAAPSLGAGAAAAPYGGTSGRALAGHQLAVRHASRAMAASLQEEHAAAAEFEAVVTRRVLAPPQAAQLLIQSYPWPPDCLALATWVAAESGEPEALAALAAEAQARAVSAAAAVAGTVAGKGAPAASPFVVAAPPHAVLAAAAANATASSVNTGLGPSAAMFHSLR